MSGRLNERLGSPTNERNVDMTKAYFTPKQRDSIIRAAKECPATFARGGDVVDYASESGNYFWTGLDDRTTRIALRLISVNAAWLNRDQH